MAAEVFFEDVGDLVHVLFTPRESTGLKTRHYKDWKSQQRSQESAKVADLKIGHCTKRTQDGGVKPPLHKEFGLGGKTRGSKRNFSLRGLRSK